MRGNMRQSLCAAFGPDASVKAQAYIAVSLTPQNIPLSCAAVLMTNRARGHMHYVPAFSSIHGSLQIAYVKDCTTSHS